MDKSKEVLELNPFDQVFGNLDYYKWLKEKKKENIHAILTKKEYLADRLNFVSGIDSLDEKALKVLKYTEQFYFDNIVMNDLVGYD